MAQNVRVVARFRPLNESEKRYEEAKQGEPMIRVDGESSLSMTAPEMEGRHDFTFDRVFDQDSTQADVFDYVGRDLARDIVNGYNGTIFAYGQTSAGKTFTMEGPRIDDESMAGIIPRMVASLFAEVEAAESNLEFTFKVSFVEIYLEKIRDLLENDRVNLRVREDKHRGVWVDGAEEKYCDSPAAVMEVLRRGQMNRSVGATKMNIESSRSHSILILTLHQKNLETGSSKEGKLYLVDLAGSEKVKKTGAAGQLLDEAKNINKSLSMLGNVINALTDPKATHIPYRDSKLTRVLQESLGGNARTTLIICCSPSLYNAAETLSTLRFGNRAKSIKNKPRVNEERSAAELKMLLGRAEKEIAQLKELLGAGGAGTDLPQVAELQEQLLEAEERVRMLESDIGDVSNTLEAANEALEGKTRDLADRVAAMAALEARVVELEAANAEVGKENDQLVANLANVQYKYDTAAYENQELQLSSVSAQATIDSLRSELEAAQEEARAAAAKARAAAEAAVAGGGADSHTGSADALARARTVFAKDKTALETATSSIAASLAADLDQADTLQRLAAVESDRDALSARVAQLQSELASRPAAAASQQQQQQDAAALSPASLIAIGAGGEGRAPLSDDPVELKAHIARQREQMRGLSQIAQEQETRIARLEEQYSATVAFIKEREDEWSSANAVNAAAEATGRGGGDGAGKLEAELRELREKTRKDLNEFDALKDALLSDLQERCEHVVELELQLDEARDQIHKLMRSSATKPLQKKVLFLERNLEQLAHVHHQVVNQNTALTIDASVVEKKVNFQAERIRYLEYLLKDAHEKLRQQASASDNELASLRDALDKEKASHDADVSKLNGLIDEISGTLGGGASPGLGATVASRDTPHKIAKPIRGGGGGVGSGGK